MVLTRQREEALAGFCLILFGKIIPESMYETTLHTRVDFPFFFDLINPNKFKMQLYPDSAIMSYSIQTA